jgi:hypothetical protein
MTPSESSSEKKIFNTDGGLDYQKFSSLSRISHRIFSIFWNLSEFLCICHRSCPKSPGPLYVSHVCYEIFAALM